MPRNTSPIYLRLLADMPRAGKIELPREFRHAGRATQPLQEPLTHVPVGTLVTLKIEVPDNKSGKFYALGWRCGDNGLSLEEARAEICELLVDNFLDLIMPLP